MTRTLQAFAWVLSWMLIVRGIDYATGNQFDMGRVFGDHVAMPVYWGVACLAVGFAAAAALFFHRPILLQNVSLVGFAVNFMFAIQVYDSRMLPVPWPPEDIRMITDHIGHAALWFLVAASLWWREGINRRREVILEGVSHES